MRYAMAWGNSSKRNPEFFFWLGSDLEPTWQIIKLLNTLKDIWTIKTQPSQLQQDMQGEAFTASLLETTTFNLSKDFFVEKDKWVTRHIA